MALLLRRSAMMILTVLSILPATVLTAHPGKKKSFITTAQPPGIPLWRETSSGEQVSTPSPPQINDELLAKQLNRLSLSETETEVVEWQMVKARLEALLEELDKLSEELIKNSDFYQGGGNSTETFDSNDTGEDEDYEDQDCFYIDECCNGDITTQSAQTSHREVGQLVYGSKAPNSHEWEMPTPKNENTEGISMVNRRLTKRFGQSSVVLEEGAHWNSLYRGLTSNARDSKKPNKNPNTKAGTTEKLPMSCQQQADSAYTFASNNTQPTHHPFSDSPANPVNPRISESNKRSKTAENNSSKPHLPRHACIVNNQQQFKLTEKLLSHPHMDHYFVKERKEISPGSFLATLNIKHGQDEERKDSDEDDTTLVQKARAAVMAYDAQNRVENEKTKRESEHFPKNTNKPGYIVFSSDLGRFSGNTKYPLPGPKATIEKIGKGGNGFVFAIFHNGKEFAVKKTIYRPNEIRVHSQLAHINLVNLEAVLLGDEHEKHKGKYYTFNFMNRMDMDLRSVISNKEHSSLKHLKLHLHQQRETWELVVFNLKYILRSTLNALVYMHSQGLVHRDIKASNIMLKMNCQCRTKPLLCQCPQKYQVKLGDFDSSTNVPGHGLKIEPHQMIRYASVLPLGTMGYRAPEVSMLFVLSGPYEVLYSTAVDIWGFGCLVLNILIGKTGPLKQRGEASLLLTLGTPPYSEELYNKIIKIKELAKYYGDMPEMVDLVQKCLKVNMHLRPTAKSLLQLDVLQP